MIRIGSLFDNITSPDRLLKWKNNIHCQIIHSSKKKTKKWQTVHLVIYTFDVTQTSGFNHEKSIKDYSKQEQLAKGFLSDTTKNFRTSLLVSVKILPNKPTLNVYNYLEDKQRSFLLQVIFFHLLNWNYSRPTRRRIKNQSIIK